ncbi:DNA adenine methylase [Sorangium sp. So ce136]|uniref:DNA adenine methylase n=1 Tax=Sorangium sp. So ce136 TaxID=3133284 RepID=UPI003F08007A
MLTGMTRQNGRAAPLVVEQSPPVPSGTCNSSNVSQAGLPRPFLKWVGGKRQLLPHIVEHLPCKYGTYHEPFLGGGALFFHLRPDRPILSDSNSRLIRTYRGVRDNVEQVIHLLQSYPHDKKFYLKFRQSKDIDNATDTELAAWFIYLNRTGYNGLYRVNRKNIFNVPFGDYDNPKICDPDNLRICSQLLQRADIALAPFDTVLDRAKSDDFVYFDPPYVPLSATSSFTSYTSDGFGSEDQRRLRDVALQLKKKGVHVLLSNSSAKAVYELYSSHFEVIPVYAKRAINCKGSARGRVRELLMK